MNERLALVAQMDPFTGKYFSLEYMRKHILKQTEPEFEEIEGQMEQEIADGKLVSPVTLQQLEVEQMEMALQPEPAEEEYQGVDPKDYKKGEI